MIKLLTIIIFTEHLINAIGSTLIQSLWQGLVLAGVTGLVIVTTRSQKASTRYNLFISLLLIFFLGTIVTFADFLIGLTSSSTGKSVIGITNSEVINAKSLIPSSVILEQVKTYLYDHHQILVLLWFLIVSARSFQLLIGLDGLSHLRKNASFTVSDEWKVRIDDYARKLGIKQAIRIAECNLIKVPMVIGHLKPLILLPMGLFTALPPKEIEAILVHELAHIYRRDYLINLLQNGMEIVFFFNPAVLWLSDLIKVERENCCDDIAIRLTNSKINYISALIACQEYQQAVPAYAITFSAKGGLRSRVQRLVGNKQSSLNSGEKLMLIAGMLAIGFGLLSFSYAPRLEKFIYESKSRIGKTVKKQVAEITKASEPVVKIRTPKIKTAALKPKTILKSTAVTPSPIFISPVGIDSIRPRLAKIRNRLKSQANLSSLNLGLSPTQPFKKPLSQVADLPIGDRVAQELYKDSLIVKVDINLSFKLSNTELIVNGKRQPPEIYQKYKDKFVPIGEKITWILYYNYNTSTKTSTG